MWGFHTSGHFVTPAGSPTQFDSDTIYLTLGSNPTSWWFCTTRLPPLQMPIANLRLSPVFLIAAINWGFHDPLLGFDTFLRKAHKTREITLSCLFKGYNTGYEWIARWSGSWVQDLLCLWNRGVRLSQHGDVFTNPRTSRTHMEASTHRHHQLLIQSLVPPLFPEDGRVRWIVPSLSSQLCLSDDQPIILKLFRSPPRVASLEQKAVLSPRTLQEFQEPCIRNWVWRPNIRGKKRSS